jgi:hypothetical protein
MKKSQACNGLKIEYPLKKTVFLSLIDLRRRKNEIGREKKQLDLEEENVDEAIASLEEEFRLAVKEEKASEEEEEEEEEEYAAGIVRFSDVTVEEEDENMEADLVEEEEEVKDEEEEEEDMDEDDDGTGYSSEGFDTEQQFHPDHHSAARARDEEEEEEYAARARVRARARRAKPKEEWLEDVYASKWLEQDGHNAGIPKKYSPCVYFFKARDGCQKNECEFSHNEMFRQEPFAALLKNLSWEKKERKTFTCPQPPPFPPGPGPPKKHRWGKCDEEDL